MIKCKNCGAENSLYVEHDIVAEYPIDEKGKINYEECADSNEIDDGHRIWCNECKQSSDDSYIGYYIDLPTATIQETEATND